MDGIARGGVGDGGRGGVAGAHDAVGDDERLGEG